jgi:N-acetylmuramoyl-L-alanine amidase
LSVVPADVNPDGKRKTVYVLTLTLPSFDRIKALGGLLQKGDQGIGAVVLRAGLHRLGYGLTPGGDYDAETETTVRAFQRHWRPDRIDGVADGETRARLVGLLQLASVESVTGVLD